MTDVIRMGNQSSVTIVDMSDPAREVGAPDAKPKERPARKQRRVHQDKQRHEAHEDKQGDETDG